VPQPGTGRRQIGIAAMNSEQENRLGAQGVFSQPREYSPQRLQPPKSSGRRITQCSKQSVVFRGECSIASALREKSIPARYFGYLPRE
jgi:hypothetical protein